MTKINVITHEVLGAAVSGRELYGLIAKTASKRDIFSDWALDRVRRFDLVQGVDYLRSEVMLPQFSRVALDYSFTISAAIKIAAFQPVGRGQGVLKFLEAYQANPDVAQFESAAPAPAAEGLFAPAAETTAPERIEQPVSQPAETKPGHLNGSAHHTEHNGKALPAPAADAKPLTPTQLLLAEVQRLADAEQARAQADPNGGEALARFESRMQLAEARAEVMLTAFEQVVTALRGLNGVGIGEDTPEPENALQSKVMRLVNAFAAATQRTERDVWRQLYGHFTIHTDFDPYAVKNRQGRSYLTVIEQRGHLETLYDIAKKVFVLPELAKA